MSGLDGKTAIVTGASRGIGREISAALGEAGARVAAVARSEADLDETVSRAAARGGEARAWTCDVTDPESVESMVASVTERWGPVDVLVNNAGQRQNFSRIDELEVDEWRRVVDANLSSVFYVSRAVAAPMIENGGGSIVNVASIAGPVAFPRIGAYCAAKAGVIALTRVMAAEWAEHGIRVNAVAPGWIESPMNVELRTDPKNRELLESIKARTLLGRFGTAAEIAATVVFLTGPQAGYVTGETVMADGGWTTV